MMRWNSRTTAEGLAWEFMKSLIAMEFIRYPQDIKVTAMIRSAKRIARVRSGRIS